jgi:hypothetical protein
MGSNSAATKSYSNTYTSLSQKKYYDATSLRRQAAILIDAATSTNAL